MSANEDVLRWIAQEVDAGREVSAARVAAAWEIDELGAERALGEDWLAFRAMECGHERRDMHGSGEYCAACRHDERHKADFPAGMTDDQVADEGERIWAQFGRGPLPAPVQVPPSAPRETRDVLEHPMGGVLGQRRARPRCSRCGGLLSLEYDELGIGTDNCLACGPLYGRRPPSPEDLAETAPAGKRGPSSGGSRL